MKESSDGSTANNIFNRLIDLGSSYLTAEADKPAPKPKPIAPQQKTNWLPWAIGGGALLILGLLLLPLLLGRRGTA